MPGFAVEDLAPRGLEKAWLAPGAIVAGDVALGEGVNVWFNAVVRGDLAPVRIGSGANVQDGAVLHVDHGFPLDIGDRVIVGHRAVLHGCAVEDDALIGMGAVVLNGARIGRGSVVAAGALVREGEQIPPFSLVVGVPATVRRTLPEAETLAAHRSSAEEYVRGARSYRGGMREVAE